MLCPACEKKHQTNMQLLLTVERAIHASTARKLEKADHDRQRYKKRIRFLDARHQVICRELHAARKEAEILNTAVNLLERRLLSYEQPDAKT